MVRRTGIGRYANVQEAAGDPLDGLVNLFDIGIVLAVAFLLAGLGVTLGQRAQPRAQRARTSEQVEQGAQALAPPMPAPPASGRGRAVGTVYRLADGRLVLVPDGHGGRVGGNQER